MRQHPQWGDRWAVDTPPVTLRHRDHDYLPRPCCATCGEPVRPGDVHRVFDAPGWDQAGPVPAAPGG